MSSQPKTSSKHGTHVGIIGGGLAGLSAAVELAGQGLKVTLIEANRHLGGKMNLIEDQGYSFDMGPTIITMPQVFRGHRPPGWPKPEPTTAS
jgi:phytoene dehydrogenase-like protein